MLAFTFPGQGSQRQGMGRAWVDHPSWEVVGEASAVAGRDLARLLLDADQDELTLTANAQLATYRAQPGRPRRHRAGGIEPDRLRRPQPGRVHGPHGRRRPRLRGRGPAGGGAGRGHAPRRRGAAGDDGGRARGRRRRRGGGLPAGRGRGLGGQLQRPRPGGDRRRRPRPWPWPATIAKELGARRVMPFPVAGAFHTALMAPARSRLRKALADAPFSAPEVPVVANVDARVHPGPEEWPGLLSAQLCSPVRWRQSLVTLSELGTTQVVEVGPGRRPHRPGPPDPARCPGAVGGLARRPRRPGRRPSRAPRPGTPTPPPTRASTSTPPSGSSSPPPPGSSPPIPGWTAPGPGGLTAARRHRAGASTGRRRGRRGRPPRPGGRERGADPLRRPGGRLPGPRR